MDAAAPDSEASALDTATDSPACSLVVAVWNSPACQQCMIDRCLQTCQVCAGSAKCQEFVTCMGEAGDSAFDFMNCGTFQSQATAALWQALADCIKAQCNPDHGC